MSDQSGEFPVWCNGRLLRAGENCLTAGDAGFTVGAGMFETLLALEGEPFEWDRHYARLADGLGRLGIAVPSRDELGAACRTAATAAGHPRLRLRVTVSAGPQAPGASLDPNRPPTIVVNLSPAPPRPEFVRLATVSGRRNPDSPLAGTKSISYAENIALLAEARRAGADEALVLNTRGEICEAATANVFLVRHDRLLTPPLSSGCLPGVARALVLEDAVGLGLKVDTSVCYPEDVLTAEEVFLTSSTRGVVPVASLDGHPLPLVGGPITSSLLEARLRRERVACGIV